MSDANTKPEELLALADLQAYARAQYCEDDADLIRESADLIRESIVTEYALRALASRPMDREERLAVARSGFAALFEPEEADAIDNLEGALIDLRRLSEQGKPADEVCIRTLGRIQQQLLRAYVAFAQTFDEVP